MNWQGPGILFRNRKEKEIIKSTLEFKPILVRLMSREVDGQKDESEFQKLNSDKLLHLEFVDIPADRPKSEVNEYLTLMEQIEANDIFYLLFVVWDRDTDPDFIVDFMDHLTARADKRKNALIICSLAVDELKLFHQLEKIHSPFLFMTYGYLKQKGRLINPIPFICKKILGNMRNQIFQGQIANQILLEGSEGEMKSVKDYQLCLQLKRNPVMDFRQRGVRIFGLYMNDKKTTFSEQWMLIGIRTYLVKYARKYLYEPNNPALWKKVERDISFILKEIWQLGVLKGNRPEEAFYVICNESNNSFSEGESFLNVHVGVALTQPAQFFEIELKNLVEVIPG